MSSRAIFWHVLSSLLRASSSYAARSMSDRALAGSMMSQILRAATSVPSNIEEAQAAQSKADFISKMSIALREARETHLRLRLLATDNIVPENRLRPLISETDEIKRVIGAIIVSTKRSDRGQS